MLRIARGGVGKVPLSSLQDASRCCVCIAIPNWSRSSHHTAHLSHIISVLIIPIEFPTLLAMREIIANAFFLARISPRTDCKITEKKRISKEIWQKCGGRRCWFFLIRLALLWKKARLLRNKVRLLRNKAGLLRGGGLPPPFPLRPTEMLRYSVLLYCIFFFFLELVDWKKCRYNYYK